MPPRPPSPSRNRLAALAAALGCALVTAATPALAQRSGIYEVAGTNLDGTPYTGLAEIQQAGLASFRIQWRVGQTLIEGIGMASGRTISVVYGTQPRPGMGIYVLAPDGSMEGEWTLFGASAIGRETLTPRPTPATPPAAPTPATPPAAPTPPAVTPPAR